MLLCTGTRQLVCGFCLGNLRGNFGLTIDNWSERRPTSFLLTLKSAIPCTTIITKRARIKKRRRVIVWRDVVLGNCVDNGDTVEERSEFCWVMMSMISVRYWHAHRSTILAISLSKWTLPFTPHLALSSLPNNVYVQMGLHCTRNGGCFGQNSLSWYEFSYWIFAIFSNLT